MQREGMLFMIKHIRHLLIVIKGDIYTQTDWLRGSRFIVHACLLLFYVIAVSKYTHFLAISRAFFDVLKNASRAFSPLLAR